jgi:cell division protein FtsB
METQIAKGESERKTLFLRVDKLDKNQEEFEKRISALETDQAVARKEIPFWIKDAVAEGNKEATAFFLLQVQELKKDTAELKKQVKDLEDKPSKIIASSFYKYLGIAIGVFVTILVTLLINNFTG